MTRTTRAAAETRRYRMLHKVELWLETPMLILALVWLWLLIAEFTRGLTPLEQKTGTAIWALFILDFVITFILAPKKLLFLRQNWLLLISLAVPALRIFRVARALGSLARLSRGLGSANQVVSTIRDIQGPPPAEEMNIGILLAHTSGADKDGLLAFIRQLTDDCAPELKRASGIPWKFHITEPAALDTDPPHRASDFLDEASMRMAEGPYDAVVVVTDAALISRRKMLEAGLASHITRIAVISTRRLITAPRGKPVRTLTAKNVRANAAWLLLHLLGHLAGLKHTAETGDRIMAPFAFDEARTQLPRFHEAERQQLKERGPHLPEHELHDGGFLQILVFHILMALRHPGHVLRPLMKSNAILLPLSLPGLATAAVAPTFLLVFTAEIWDVGLSMTNRVAILYAVLSILGATWYLITIQSLFLPRKERRVLTEHLAVANTVIFLSILLACIGLFLMVGGLMLAVEVYIFPEDLIKTWPTIDQPEVTLGDKLRLAAFISTVGVTTGALAGGLENRTVIQQLALFQEKP